MQNLWNRLEAWLKANAPGLLTTLQPGASEAEFQAVEAQLGVQLPEDFKAAYRIHNGQVPFEDGLIDGRELLSLERMLDEWQVWKGLLDNGDFEGFEGEPVGPIRPDWWHPHWIPLTYDGAGNHDCLDLAPAAGGHVGQIIDFWHDDARRELKAASFTAWLTEFVDGCESGRYVYSEEYGGIVESTAGETDGEANGKAGEETG